MSDPSPLIRTIQAIDTIEEKILEKIEAISSPLEEAAVHILEMLEDVRSDHEESRKDE